MIVPRREHDDAGLPILNYATFESQIGRFLLLRSAEGLMSVRFARDLDVGRELGRLTEGRRVVVVEDRLSLEMVIDWIREYLHGGRRRFDHRLDLSDLGDFGRSVLEVTAEIPYGTLRSYKWVADRVGRPRATRPVGQALARNPIPIVIPCHRVVNNDGTLGGYSGGGTDMKHRLIEIETGQTGLALDPSDEGTRRRIRFMLDAES